MTLSQQAPSLVERLTAGRWATSYQENPKWVPPTALEVEAAATELEQKLQATDAAWDDDIRLLTASTARAERAEADVAALTKALTGLTCGGSEFFVRRGDGFVADVDACVAWVRRSKADANRRTVEAFKARRRAEAQCRVLSGLLEELTAVVRGECPSLLNEDSGGYVDLSCRIDDALSLSGGGEPVQKLHELEPAANHPENPDSSSQSPPSADAGPYSRSLDDQRSRALAAFATQVLEALWEGYDLDGGEIQDLGQKFGLIKAVAYDPRTHVDVHGVGPELGDEWFIQEPWLTDLAATYRHSDGGRG